MESRKSRHSKKSGIVFALSACFVGLASPAVACGSTAANDSGAADASADAALDVRPDRRDAAPPLDHGQPSETYPAFPPAMGQLLNHGGPVLADPVVVTVTWPDDQNADQLELFGDSVGKGAYWTAVTSEYGAGPATSGADDHVRLTDAGPATITDTDLSAFVASSLTSATPWPVPATGQPIYILYLPQATKLMLQGKSACSQGVGGYHDSVNVGGKEVPFAIIPHCGNSDIDRLTNAASHELAEATTDPNPRTAPAWTGFTPESIAWDIFQEFQSEDGDACEFYRDSTVGGSATDVGFAVQRQWSNVSAKAGHDPCVPVIGTKKYFNVTPLDLDDGISVSLSSIGKLFPITTKGYKIKVGESRTIALGFYSDGPTGEPWSTEATAGGITGGLTGNLDLTLDIAIGQNGQKAYLTIVVNEAGVTGADLVTIVSKLNGVSHYMPFLVGR